MFSATIGEGKAPPLDKFRNRSYQVHVLRKSVELPGEATIPNSVTSRCQIYKHGTAFSFCF